MKAYKGFKKHEDGTLWCRGFQYEVGKTYKFDGKPILCALGFHACHEPWQCWVFYPNNGKNVYYEVECGGKLVESNNGDGKFVCTEITLVKEIPAPEDKFDWCYFFHDGYAIVGVNDKYNFIDTKGKYVSEEWFDDCYSFRDGYAKVCLNDKYNYINDGSAIVKLNGKWNYIDTDGKPLSEQWFDCCWNFQDGYAKVCLNGRYNYINTDGKYLFEQWWDYCSNPKDGYVRVDLKGKWYIKQIK